VRRREELPRTEIPTPWGDTKSSGGPSERVVGLLMRPPSVENPRFSAVLISSHLLREWLPPMAPNHTVRDLGTKPRGRRPSLHSSRGGQAGVLAGGENTGGQTAPSTRRCGTRGFRWGRRAPWDGVVSPRVFADSIGRRATRAGNQATRPETQPAFLTRGTGGCTRRGRKHWGTDGSVHAAPWNPGFPLGAAGALGRSRQSQRFRAVSPERKAQFGPSILSIGPARAAPPKIERSILPAQPYSPGAGERSPIWKLKLSRDWRWPRCCSASARWRPRWRLAGTFR
jgi:hypothetical protein